MADLLANIPWWLTGVVLLAGIVVVVHANSRNQSTARSIGLLMVSLGVLMGLCPFLIDTDAERCERRTRQIVQCADQGDWTRMQSLLDAKTHTRLGNKWSDEMGAETIAKSAQTVANQIKLKSVFIISLKTEQEPNQITVTFSAATVQDPTQDRPYPSGWEFDYVPDGKAWRLAEIKLLSLGSESLQ
jgi:hypothetical protein